MNLLIERDDANRCTVFRGAIPDEALAALQLDPMERALLRDPGNTAADCLLTFEKVFRRWQEQQHADASPQAELALEG